jgi:formate dehydrogenase subunit gamma
MIDHVPSGRKTDIEDGGRMTIHGKIDDLIARARSITLGLKDIEGPLLPILHAVQAEFGYVPDAVLPVIATELNLSRAEVHGVVSFYHEFRHDVSGKHVLRICRSEACQSMGGRDLEELACDALGVDWHETTPDGKVTLEPVYCLGLCSVAPAAQLDSELHGRLDRAELATIIREARQ